MSLAIFAWPLAVWLEVKKLEKPKYTVLKELGPARRFVDPIQIRRYAPYLIAEAVFEDGDMRSSLSQGFRQIAGFIFGKNTAPGADDGPQKVAMTSPVVLEQHGGKAASAKIAMTSPVAAEMSDDKKFKVSFVMPSKYTKETLPIPDNDAVQIREVPAHTLASISWRGGRVREKEVEQKRQELVEQLKKHDITVDSNAPVKVYQYYPPFAPGWIRLNEVLLPIDYEGSATATS